MFVGRVREAAPALERARVEEPLMPENALYLSLARTVDRNYPEAFAEIDRGLETRREFLLGGSPHRTQQARPGRDR